MIRHCQEPASPIASSKGPPEGTADPLPPADDAGPYTWLCTSCGSKLSDGMIGKVYQSRFQFTQLLTTQCPLCGGVARNICQLREIRTEEERMEALQLRKRRNGWLATGASFLLLLALPAVAEFYLWFGMLLWVGPLRRLELRSKLAMFLIAGFCTIFLSELGFFYPYGDWLTTLSVFMGLAVLTLVIGFVLHIIMDKAGSLGASLFYRS